VGVLTQLLAGQNYPLSPHASWLPFLDSQRSLKRPERLHVAAVCYRVRGGEPEFLLVCTRNGRWTFPKGGVDRDATPAAAAAREAYEEAGVKGSVEHIPFASYRHSKRRKPRTRNHVVMVHAYLCEVKRLDPPLEDYRTPSWFRADHAKRRLRKLRSTELAAEIGNVIDRAAQLIQLR